MSVMAIFHQLARIRMRFRFKALRFDRAHLPENFHIGHVTAMESFERSRHRWQIAVGIFAITGERNRWCSWSTDHQKWASTRTPCPRSPSRQRMSLRTDCSPDRRPGLRRRWASLRQSLP
jgi:hypothetical protein